MLVWLKPQEKRGWDAAYWEPSAETTLTRVMSPTQVQDPTGAEAMAEGDSSSMETASSEGKVHGLPEVPGSPEDYPLDKDFSMVAEGTQMKEGSDQRTCWTRRRWTAKSGWKQQQRKLTWIWWRVESTLVDRVVSQMGLKKMNGTPTGQNALGQ